MGVMRPELAMRNIIPVVMAGVLAVTPVVTPLFTVTYSKHKKAGTSIAAAGLAPLVRAFATEVAGVRH